jgi:SAM-dependent methyltransferase
MPVNPGLHEHNPVGRFSDRAQDYVKYRPSYPAAAIDAVLDDLGPPARLRAADVGAGTGISARLLASRGVRVVAVEPGDGMRHAAEPHPNVLWVNGYAEATGLEPRSVAVVLCAQSFHWFKQGDALVEFARILAPGGRLALVWNRRSKKDPFTAGFRQAILDSGGESPAERMEFDPAVVAESGLFGPLERLVFSNSQRLDVDGLIGRARSASYVPKDGEAGSQLVQVLRALHQQSADADGMVTIVYETELFRATLAPRPA